MPCSTGEQIKMHNLDPGKVAAGIIDGPLKPELQELDRSFGVHKRIGSAVILSGIIIGVLILRTGWGIYVGVFGVFIGAAIIISCRKKQQVFFREKILPQLLKAVAPSLKYHPHSGIARSRFEGLKIFGHFDRYSSEDRITGMLDKTRIEAGEVHIEKRQRDKNGKTTYSTIFRGVIFIADFNKHFNCRTVVMPDVAERCFGKLIGSFLQRMNFMDGSAVRLENPEFEKYFSIYSSDQIEARYLLTPDFMEWLLALRKLENNNIRVIFQDSNIAIALKRSNGWLEPPFFGKLASQERLEKLLNELIAILQLVDTLNLNTRIWSKQ